MSLLPDDERRDLLHRGDITAKSQSNHPSQTNHNLFISCLALFHEYLFFEVDERTGKARTENDILNLHYGRVQQLQTLCYRDLPSLKEIAVSSVSSFNTNGDLDMLLMFAPNDSLVRLAEILDVIGTDEDEVDADEESEKLALSSKVLIELVAERFTRKPSQVALFKIMPLFLTERMFWNTNSLPLPPIPHHPR
ncbi:putative Intron-binding protein aquarius N-terminus [Blattamonas nauphoetae]|uniref:Intron-binding protein aquarius N-terminus n=1 Tax=Blattamonas nauphoetae TaxID=2049346 RepID=A0ABQ9XYG9_9EUKA|nr:putative Intron-binding protein aquarius N-terminus [Blattamonas nauphoetae]